MAIGYLSIPDNCCRTTIPTSCRREVEVYSIALLVNDARHHNLNVSASRLHPFHRRIAEERSSVGFWLLGQLSRAQNSIVLLNGRSFELSSGNLRPTISVIFGEKRHNCLNTNRRG